MSTSSQESQRLAAGDDTDTSRERETQKRMNTVRAKWLSSIGTAKVRCRMRTCTRSRRSC